jgi:hypothetical protein
LFRVCTLSFTLLRTGVQQSGIVLREGKLSDVADTF